jgi:hypothetical protein
MMTYALVAPPGLNATMRQPNAKNPKTTSTRTSPGVQSFILAIRYAFPTNANTSQKPISARTRLGFNQSPISIHSNAPTDKRTSRLWTG